MTVSELIAKLQEMPQDAAVVLCDDSEGTEWRMASVDLYTFADRSTQVEFR